MKRKQESTTRIRSADVTPEHLEAKSTRCRHHTVIVLKFRVVLINHSANKQTNNECWNRGKWENLIRKHLARLCIHYDVYFAPCHRREWRTRVSGALVEVGQDGKSTSFVASHFHQYFLGNESSVNLHPRTPPPRLLYLILYLLSIREASCFMTAVGRCAQLNKINDSHNNQNYFNHNFHSQWCVHPRNLPAWRSIIFQCRFNSHLRGGEASESTRCSSLFNWEGIKCLEDVSRDGK